ncbi:carbohydrate ABC transporter permease [Arthrobacter russicus]|jgi:ABC-type sugar transport system permease subunit|uniref:Multiple sugar transport system permease protein/N,N'-diacetylchitobiose transport system permease protein n=1 Tax=Arthrobacter russicus TaxID=172040 RepID=A0ABU1JBB3_9MICC|nr:sugar ABC transporter permease [Arthrobacter russicus]MDR6269712.1 multiple sugar transport system permease protein/N,N'-diacetylchitobiose transport system permease protein [Arthrobacter russicus]
MRRREFALLIGPSLLVMFGLLVVPLIRTIQWSFQKVQYGEPGEFIGLGNFSSALSDPRFGRAVFFTLLITTVVTVMILVLGYLVATGMNRLGRLQPVILGAMLVSYVLPNIVGAVSFSWLFDQNFGGVVSGIVRSLTGAELLWFTETWPNRIMVIANTVWHLLPFSMLMILAALQGVPAELREASKIDGASPWQTHRYVIIPAIRGILGFVCLITIMDVLRTFDNLIPLSPQADAIGNESIMLYIYDVAFRDGSEQLGLGSAINVLAILLILICLFPFIRGLLKEAKVRA